MLVDELRHVPTLRDDRPAGGAHVVERAAHELGAETLTSHRTLDDRVREDDRSALPPEVGEPGRPAGRPSTAISYRERSSLRSTSTSMLRATFADVRRFSCRARRGARGRDPASVPGAGGALLRRPGAPAA